MAKNNEKPKRRKVKWLAHKPDPAWTKFRRAHYYLDDKPDSPEAVLQNSIYVVAIYKHPVENIGNIMHLVINRVDGKPTRNWEDLQRIKNEIAGEEVEGVELFPSEKRKVDHDKIHLWCLPPNQVFPFGFIDRIVS